MLILHKSDILFVRERDGSAPKIKFQHKKFFICSSFQNINDAILRCREYLDAGQLSIVVDCESRALVGSDTEKNPVNWSMIASLDLTKNELIYLRIFQPVLDF